MTEEEVSEVEVGISEDAKKKATVADDAGGGGAGNKVEEEEGGSKDADNALDGAEEEEEEVESENADDDVAEEDIEEEEVESENADDDVAEEEIADGEEQEETDSEMESKTEETENDPEENERLNDVTKRKGSMRPRMEDDDEDSMIAMDPRVMNKPLLDLTSEEIMQLPRKRARKATQVLVPEVFKTWAPPPRTKPVVESGQSWWVGDFKKNKRSKHDPGPDLEFPDGVNPLYARIHDNPGTTIEEFAEGNLKRPDTDDAADYQRNRNACKRLYKRQSGPSLNIFRTGREDEGV